MEWIIKPNIGFKHKIGNMIYGIFKIIDGLIMLITFGNIATNFSLNFTIVRKRKNWLLDNK
jgi:hypothetical protein